MTYNAAYTTHRECVRGMTEARMGGKAAAPELVDSESKAHAELNDPRSKLHAAMAESVPSGDDSEPRSSKT